MVIKQDDEMIYDTTDLHLNRKIIDQADVQLESYTHETGALILSATLQQPEGQVFFETDDYHLQLFYTDKINLQSLFEASEESIVTVTEDYECKLYLRRDVEILLNGGQHFFSQFKN